MHFKSTHFVFTAFVVSGLTACIGDGTDEDLGSAEQDVTSTGLTGMYSCSTTGSQQQASCDINLNVRMDSQHVCVLAGVQGQLHGNTIGGGVASVGSGSYYKDANGNWVHDYHLHLDPGWGLNRTIRASAICTTPYGPALTQQGYYTGGSWKSGQPATFIGNVPGLQCFLSGISNYDGFGNNTDNVSVYQVGNDWYIGGHQASGTTLTASATCFVPTGGSLWGWSYGWNNGTNTLNLTQNDPNANGIACGLDKIEGAFTTTTDRIQMWYDASLTQWKVTLASLSGGHKAVDARCYN